MLKRPKTPIEDEVPNKKEEDIVSLENRRSRAESEFLIICEDKKRISGEIAKIESAIKAGKDEIEKNNQEIIETNQAIADTKALLRDEKQTLKDYIKEKEAIKASIDTDIAEKTKRKNGISNNIVELSAEHDLNKETYAKEIKILQCTKTGIESDIKTLELKKTDLEASTKTAQTILNTLNSDVRKLQDQIPPLEKSITACENTIEDQKNIIANNKVIIGQQEASKKEKESEIATLDEKIVKKEEEYKVIESKAFAIVRERELLDNRETFIKSQYERAGIKWE